MSPWERFAASDTDAAQPVIDVFGLIVPVCRPATIGSPCGVVAATGAPVVDAPAHMVTFGQLRVDNPATPVSIHRLPVDYPTRPSERPGALQIRGAANLGTDQPHLAGTYLDFSLALEKADQTPPDTVLSVKLLDRSGASVAGWEGWPLPAYPPSLWPTQGLTLAPISLYLPADMPTGRYALSASISHGTQAAHGAPQRLAEIDVLVRPAITTRPEPDHRLQTPVQFGTHAILYGYDLDADGEGLRLTLYWEALQTLLPPHHIFVHVNAVRRTRRRSTMAHRFPPWVWRRLAREAPVNSSSRSTLFPGLSCRQRERHSAGSSTSRAIRARSQVRLPAFVDGQPAGDSAVIAVAP